MKFVGIKSVYFYDGVLAALLILFLVGMIFILRDWCYLFLTLLAFFSLLVGFFIWVILRIVHKRVKEVFASRIRFITGIFFSCCFFYCIVWLINFYYLPGKFQFISFTSDVAIAMVAFIFGWTLVRPGKLNAALFGAIMITGTVVLIYNGSNRENRKQPDLESLRSIPYLSIVVDEKAPKKKGVVTFNKTDAQPGVNIFTSLDRPHAYLMNMNGKIIHEWKPRETSLFSNEPWHYAKLLEDCELLVIVRDRGLARMTLNSEIIWSRNQRFHHDIEIDIDGNILTLMMRKRWISYRGIPIPILDDYLLILSPDGDPVNEISFYNLLQKVIKPRQLDEIVYKLISPRHMIEIMGFFFSGEIWPKQDKVYDIFHINSIQIIKNDLNDIFKKGDLLFCSKYMDMVGVIDIEEEKLIWHWGRGFLDYPHHPTLLPNGNIILFDNGTNRGYSRVVEIDPVKKKIVWTYQAIPRHDFDTYWGGACQRLDNGNTLITESEKGYVFEISNSGEKVWEFYNPDRNKDGKRATIYRLLRITDIGSYPCLSSMNGIQDKNFSD